MHKFVHKDIWPHVNMEDHHTVSAGSGKVA